MLKPLLISFSILLMPGLAAAESASVVTEVEVLEWKAVFGRIEARDRIPARSRLGGTVVSIEVAEGSQVAEGDVIGTVTDEKLAIQLDAIDAQLDSLQAQLGNAEAELARGENLLQRGVTTAQRLDALRTEVAVLKGQIGATQAERQVLVQRTEEGTVLAPISGTVLEVPVTPGSFVMAGEAVATIGGGGFFLRIALPERHAHFLEQGATIRIEGDETAQQGTLAKIYPQIENGRVVADVDVAGLPTEFVDARVLVRLPVGRTKTLVVPAAAVSTRLGLDFVTVAAPDGAPVTRTVVLGGRHEIDGAEVVEVLSGVTVGEALVTNHE